MQKELKEIVDLSNLLDYADGNEDDLQELIDAFHETVDDAFSSLKQAVEVDDDREWKESLHKLKGSFGYVGAYHLQSFCEELEEQANTSTQEKVKSEKELIHGYKQICDFLKNR